MLPSNRKLNIKQSFLKIAQAGGGVGGEGETGILFLQYCSHQYWMGSNDY